MVNYLLLLIIGFFAQLFDGAVGMGYGSFSSSLLLAIGFYPIVVSASVHTAEIFTSFFSGVSHLGYGNVDGKLLLRLMIPGVIGGVAGVFSLTYINEMLGDTLRLGIASILLFFGILITIRFVSNKKKTGKISHPLGSIRTGILGFFSAYVDAIGGGGWGPMTTSSMIISGKIEPRKVVGTISVVEFFVTLSITLTFFIYLGNKIFMSALIIPLIGGGIIAAPVAAYLCKKLPTKTLGIIIGIAIIASNIKTIIEFSIN